MSKWSNVEIGDVAEFVRGINFKPADVVPITTPNTVACMRTKNVQATLDLSDVWAVDRSFVKRKNQFLREGDILVSSANSWNLVGKCCWIPKLSWSASFGGFVSVLRGNLQKINCRYLYWWFSSDRVQTAIRSFGRQTTNISNLDLQRTLKLQIPLPPLDEQKRIAAILDKAESLLAQRRAALEKLEGLTQAVFVEMFGDPVKNERGWIETVLGEITTFTGGGTPSRKRPEFFEGSICWATSKDMKGEFLDDTKEHITNEAIAQSATKLVPSGTILMVVKSKILAHTLPIVITRVPTCFGQDIKGINVSARANVTFIATALRVKELWFLKRARGINTEGLTLDHLRDFPLLLPPLPLQQEFARRVESIEKLKGSQRASLAEMETLFKALQGRAFRGEL